MGDSADWISQDPPHVTLGSLPPHWGKHHLKLWTGQPMPVAEQICTPLAADLWDNLSPQASSMDVHNPHEACATPHCPQAVGHCIAGVPLPPAPRRCGNAHRKLHCPLPQAVRRCNARVALPTAERQCIARVPLPTAARRCGGAHRKLHRPLPIGNEEVYCRTCIARCPQPVRQCTAEVALPTTPR